MPGLVLAYVLGQDSVDSSQAAVYAQQSTDIYGQTIYQSAADVPNHEYLSLGTIWLGQPQANQISKYVVPILGAGTSKAEGTIYVVNMQQIDSPFAPKGFKSDQPGMETTTFDIIFQKARNITSLTTVRDAEFRVRTLLDLNLRGQVHQLPPDLPTRDGMGNKIDPTIADSVFKCYFQGWIYNENNSCITSRYRVEYLRIFSQAPKLSNLV